MRRRTRSLLLVPVVGLASLVGWQAVAAADADDPGPTRGMARMHELMESGNPGMPQMHERMMGNPGARRAHERMMQRGAMTDPPPMMGGAGS